MRKTKPEEQPELVFTHSGDNRFVCHVKLIGGDGRVVDFSFTPEMAVTTITYLRYYQRKHEEEIANAPVQISPPET